MASPGITGIHHITFVVSGLDDGIAWFESVLGAHHVPRFDHHDESGARYGVVLGLPGFPGMIELRLSTRDYPLVPGYDPVTFEVRDGSALADWGAHLDGLGIPRSALKRRRTGQSLEFRTPDGAVLRLFTAPEGGFDKVPFQEEAVDH